MKLPSIKKSLWNLYTDGITQSLIAKWLDCPKQAELEYVNGWTPTKYSDAILFGEAVHHVLAEAYSTWQGPLRGLLGSYLKDFEQKRNLLEGDSATIEGNEIVLAKAEAILNIYFMRYAKDFSDNWIAAEKSFSVPFAFPDGKEISLRGKLDGGFINNEKLVLMDHKCMSRIVLDDILFLLPVDLQVNFYLYCMSIYCELNNLPFPKTFIYNIIRNPQSKPHVKENIDQYKSRLEDEIAKKMEHYFFRIKLTTNEAEVHQWAKKWLTPLLIDIRRWFDSNFTWPAYFNVRALRTMYGIAPMARAIVESDFAGLYQREVPFMELDYVESTDG